MTATIYDHRGLDRDGYDRWESTPPESHDPTSPQRC